MSNTTVKSSKPTYVFALGGIEEIGKNMYVFEHDNEIYIVDCGIKFADENELLGVNCVICPFDYLVENKDKIKGLIITHAHEDHIGGIPYLLKTLPIENIYASPLAAGIISKKLKEHSDLNKFTMVKFNDDTIIKSKHFEIEFFRVCHSIPMSYGLSLTTINGTIVSTGDFRFDFSAKVDQTDIHKICDISKKGVDLLLCETTNAEAPGFSTSEKYALDEIRRRIIRAPGRVFITTFASNLGRIENIIEIALNLKRKVCIIGKSMDANISTSIACGCLKTFKTDFIEPAQINNYSDQEVVVLLTGSQGEPTAALNMMANGKYPHIFLKPSDTILMSSNPIPGNFSQVERLINKLTKANISIIKNSATVKLHASGHATQTELHLMIKLINPKYIMPIHGEFKMLSAMESNVDFLGIKKEQYIQVVNGQKIKLEDHNVEATNIFIDTEEVYVDGKKINIDSSKLLSARKVLSQDGIFNVTIVVDRKGKKIIGLPSIITRGCFFANTSLSLISKISYALRDDIEAEMKKNVRPINNLIIRKIAENTVGYYIWKNKNKKPLVRVTVFDKFEQTNKQQETKEEKAE